MVGSIVTADVERLQGTFLEIPGTLLSAADAARLCGLEPSRCENILTVLVDTGFLRRTVDGRFCHGDQGGRARRP
jgi:DNA-binding IclR family transcriptional regulator